MRNLLTLLALLVGSTAFAQKAILIPYRQGKQWGYADTNGVVCIRPAYDSVLNYKMGSNYVVINKGKQGLVDCMGKVVVKPQYDWIYSSNSSTNGFVVKQNSKYGYVLSNGKALLPPKYNYVEENDGILNLTLNDESYTYDIATKKMVSLSKEMPGVMEVMMEEEAVDRASSNLTQAECGMGTVAIGDKHALLVIRKSIVLSSRGKVISSSTTADTIRQDFDEVRIFNLYRKYALVRSEGSWGVYILDKLAVPVAYDEVDPITVNNSCSQIFFKVRKGDSWGLISENGYEALSMSYNDILYPKTMSEGMICYNMDRGIGAKRDGRYGIVTFGGKLLVNFNLDKVTYVEKMYGDYFLCEREGKYGIYREDFKLEPSIDATEVFDTMDHISNYRLVKVLDAATGRFKGYVDQKGIRYYKD